MNSYVQKNNLENKTKQTSTYSPFSYITKRLIELILISILLIIASPIILYAIYRIKKESPGSIFFKQSRIGLDGKHFTCYKFRSMHQNMEFNPYTEDKDPRVFPFGAIMRKYRIDELAQIFNIIKGDMHLIGPRAEWDILVNEYETKIPNYHKRHSVRPGITGLAQVSYPYGRNTYDAKQKLNYDLFYINNWSLKLELSVIWKTILVILSRKGI